MQPIALLPAAEAGMTMDTTRDGEHDSFEVGNRRQGWSF